MPSPGKVRTLSVVKTYDRIELAVRLAGGRRVLDIGGQKMADCDPRSPFARTYARIAAAAREYRIADIQRQPTVDYVLDFNRPESLPTLRAILDDYRPETILCMETLEHVNYHFELMNEMAGAIERHGSAVFITVPNNGNWLFNALGWNRDHSIAFFRDIAWRFVTRSELGRFEVLSVPCMQRYLWYWGIAWAVSFFQPFSWGFLIAPPAELPGDAGWPRLLADLREQTRRRTAPQ